jgi:hypothetical protein
VLHFWGRPTLSQVSPFEGRPLEQCTGWAGPRDLRSRIRRAVGVRAIIVAAVFVFVSELKSGFG